MAAAANSLRLGLRIGSNASSVTKNPVVAGKALLAYSTLWTERKQNTRAIPAVGSTPEAQEVLDIISKQRNMKEEEIEVINKHASEGSKAWPAAYKTQIAEHSARINQALSDARRPVKAKKHAFWNEDERDTDLITDEVGEDDFEEDDMMSMAHPKLEEHREYREYARLAVWEMPLLSSKRLDLLDC